MEPTRYLFRPKSLSLSIYILSYFQFVFDTVVNLSHEFELIAFNSVFSNTKFMYRCHIFKCKQNWNIFIAGYQNFKCEQNGSTLLWGFKVKLALNLYNFLSSSDKPINALNRYKNFIQYVVFQNICISSLRMYMHEK